MEALKSGNLESYYMPISIIYFLSYGSNKQLHYSLINLPTITLH